jgi:radical SAM protein with 4Fe4S-binding SPASM domain
MNKSYRPALLSETVILEEDDKVLFLVPSKPDWIVTNKNTAAVLSLCNGRNSISVIHEMISAHPEAESAVELVNKLHANGFFKKDDSCSHHKESLYSLHLNMSESCNLNCIYCYASERENAEEGALTLDDYRKLINDVHAMGNPVTVTFTGGEPLLNKNSFAAARHCKSKGLSTYLLTNATLINPGNAAEVRDLFDSIKVSVDGSSPSIHDRHRGQGSFLKTIAAIKLLEQRGVQPEIAMTVTRLNINEIQAMADTFGSRLTFQPLYEVGNARNKELGVTGRQYFKALKTAKGVEPYSRMGRILPGMKNRGCKRCALAAGEISISATGDVFPCHMLHVPKFRAGNVKNQSFQDIYENSVILDDIRKLSVDTRDECRQCPIRLLCGGGCWARAYYAHGDLNSADDFCEYEFLAFREGLLNS